ncbi:MAG: hypothetical protein EXR86_03780 [Gammaproteobacteria bacterium]|nr:hypothetical protein [Gammaproteobacteria bacterium]
MQLDDDLPGADLIAQGLADLRLHRYSRQALLVAIGAPRLRELNLVIPSDEDLPDQPEHRLYELLAEFSAPTAHADYNALIRRLVSYEHARELTISRANPRISSNTSSQ